MLVLEVSNWLSGSVNMLIVMMSEPVFLCKKKQTNKLVGLLAFPGTEATPLLNAGCLLHSTSFEISLARRGGCTQHPCLYSISFPPMLLPEKGGARGLAFPPVNLLS